MQSVQSVHTTLAVAGHFGDYLSHARGSTRARARDHVALKAILTFSEILGLRSRALQRGRLGHSYFLRLKIIRIVNVVPDVILYMYVQFVVWDFRSPYKAYKNEKKSIASGF